MAGDLDAGLHAPRLYLRALSISDERLYCSLYTDPHVMRHITRPLLPEAARRAFRAVLDQLATDPPRARYWVLRPHDGLDDVGLMAWVPDRDDAGSAEVGVMLATPAACRGYATEAIAALADMVFLLPTGDRLWTRHAGANAPAAGLMRKLGFAPLEAGASPGQIRWHLERRAWLQRRSAFASPGGSC